MKRLLLVLCLLCSGIASAQWSVEEIQLCDRDLYDFEIATVPEDGSFYIVYNGPAPQTPTNIRFSVLYYTKDGRPVWDKEVVVSEKPFMGWTMVNQLCAVDAEGNLILSVSDSRYTDGNIPMFNAYKIGRDGKQLWGDDGIGLSTDFENLNHSMNIVPLEDGSCVFAWFQQESDFGYIRMQRLSASGEKLWGEAGKRLESDQEEYAWPMAVKAGNNEFILLFSKGSLQDFYARKMDFDGTSVWGEDVLVAFGNALPNYPLHSVFQVEPANGGVAVSWVDLRHGNTIRTLCLAYITPNGRHAFDEGANGLEIADGADSKGKIIFDKEEKSIVLAWIQGYSLLTQRIDATDGTLFWGADGKKAVSSELPIGYLSAKRAETGQYGLFFMTMTGQQQVDVNAALLGTDGGLSWKHRIATVSDFPSEKSDLTVSAFCNNQWVTAWSDSRFKRSSEASAGKRLFMQNLSVEGAAGASESAAIEQPAASRPALTVSPNPIGAQNEIAFSLERAMPVRILLTDVQGRLVETVAERVAESGRNVWPWQPAAKLKAGVYLLQLQAEEAVSSVKLIVR